MLTLLGYVLIVGVVAGVLFLLASMVFGRGEELGPLPEGTTATVLPIEGITGADVRALRFQQVVRGYKAGEVDWALARLAARIDELQAELAQARATAGIPVSGEIPRPRTVDSTGRGHAAGPGEAVPPTGGARPDSPVANGRQAP
ncbi:DivIVA domain-containing protein [Nocardia farcinica]|uniref:DivIVA domain-containing protein n=1 Tax=Nocardia farcinica TaxID=37329 RepID=UPI00245893D7|nr:DivIVA domain-containing protein [Nocardia farcinica]